MKLLIIVRNFHSTMLLLYCPKTYFERDRLRLSCRRRLGLGDAEEPEELEDRDELDEPERLEPEEELEPLEEPELEPELLLELELDLDLN